jgi:hypothetical protein
MKNKEVFDKGLKKATKIRTIIQDELRADYNTKKRLFKRTTNLDGNEVLKHLTNMLHYRAGGYPSQNSLPQHHELMNKFIVFFKFFSFLGWDKEFIHDYLKDYGIEVKILPGFEVDDYELDEDHKIKIKEVAEMEVDTFKQFLENLILYCDNLQSGICNYSNQIKRDIADNIKEECDVKKGHFTSTVMFEYRKEKERIKAEKKGKDDNLVKLKDKLDSDVTSFNEMAEVKAKDILED